VSRGSALSGGGGAGGFGRSGGPGGGPGGFGMLALNKCLEPSASGVHSGFYVAAKTLGGYPPRTITFFLEEPGLASGVRGRMRQEFLGRLGRALRNWFDEEARREQLPRAWSALLSRFNRKHELQEGLREPPNQNLSPSSGGPKPRDLSKPE
jgi:hypothetical protein